MSIIPFPFSFSLIPFSFLFLFPLYLFPSHFFSFFLPSLPFILHSNPFLPYPFALRTPPLAGTLRRRQRSLPPTSPPASLAPPSSCPHRPWRRLGWICVRCDCSPASSGGAHRPSMDARAKLAGWPWRPRRSSRSQQWRQPARSSPADHGGGLTALPPFSHHRSPTSLSSPRRRPPPRTPSGGRLGKG
jgi:hypothetical protein